MKTTNITQFFFQIVFCYKSYRLVQETKFQNILHLFQAISDLKNEQPSHMTLHTGAEIYTHPISKVTTYNGKFAAYTACIGFDFLFQIDKLWANGITKRTPTQKYMTPPLPVPELCLSKQSLQCFSIKMCKFLLQSVHGNLVQSDLWASISTIFEPSFISVQTLSIILCSLNASSSVM